MVIVVDLVSMIVSNPAAAGGTGSTAGMNPIDPVGLASITIGLIIFAYFAVTISISSYKRKKEMEARIAEWQKREEERKQKLQEALSEHSSA
jgi:hypothetical protein